MTSIILKAALLLLLALFIASNAQQDSADHMLYDTERSQLGKVSDGIIVNFHAIQGYLRTTNNITSPKILKLGRTLTKIKVFKEEQLTRHSAGNLYNAYQVILEALTKDICNLFQKIHFVEQDSNCTLEEMKRVSTLLELYSNNDDLRRNNDYIGSATAHNNNYCYCPWYKYNILQSNCSRTDITQNVLELNNKCRWCSDPDTLSNSVSTCACIENPETCPPNA